MDRVANLLPVQPNFAFRGKLRLGKPTGLVEPGRAAAFPQESTGGRLAPTINVGQLRCWGMAFWSDLFYPTCIADNKSVLGCDAGDGVTDLCSSKGDPCP